MKHRRRRRSWSSLPFWTRIHGHRVLIHKKLALALHIYRIKRATPSLSQRALRLAARYVGVKEYPAGSNLTLFGKWFGMDGVPWCAIFVSFVLSHVGRPFRFASVPLIVTAAIAKTDGLTVIPTSKVNTALAAGHPVLACFDWEGDGVPDHVGFVTHYDAKNKVVHTIEGNTGDGNWSNGGEVLREERPVGLVQAFVKVA